MDRDQTLESDPCRIARRTALALALAVLGLLSTPASVSARSATDRSRSEETTGLSDRELGHLRNIVALARQSLDDWSGWEARDQKGMEAYRYQIAFAAYALASQQFHSVPAYRDLYRDTLGRLIERMLQRPVWEFWAEVSKTSPEFDPDWEGPQPGTRDPVGEKNIMYSGHLVHMIALYEMFYGDSRWSRPGALTFRWDDDTAFVYDYSQLVERIHAEMLAPRLPESRDAGAMECEPNLVFPECNQHPTLAFLLFDRRHGTDYGTTAVPALRSFFDSTQMHDPKTGHVAAWYMVKQDRTQRIPFVNSASADGWTGAFMHVWEPELVESLYRRQRDDYISRDPETGAIRLASDPSAALGLAFFANFAVEVGDLATAALLFDYADEHYASETDARGFRYVYDPDDEHDPVTNTTDKLMALARSNRPSGLRRLHTRPWTAADAAYPKIRRVDFPRVLVRRARWDDAKRRLLLTIEPSAEPLATTSFELTDLDPERSYTLTRDGTLVAELNAGSTARGTAVRALSAGTVVVRTPVDGPQEWVLQAH